MGDRTKTEVLARELTMEHYTGFRRGMGYAKGKDAVLYDEPNEYVEKFYQNWIETANRLLETLEQHEETKT